MSAEDSKSGRGSASNKHAVSPFDILAGALDFANIEGQDSALVPLTQDVLYALVADLEMMSEYIQNNFALRESGKPLSKLDATMFALRAIHVLDSGAFLLQPHTLARRSVRGQAGAGAEAGAGAGAGAPTGTGRFNPDPEELANDSTKLILAEAFVDVRALTYKELRGRFILEAGQVWTAGGMRIMIRDHYPALFRSMCKNANVGTIGDNTAWAKRFNGGHALLRGTAGTGKSVFMFVMFIEFLKMLRAPPTEEVAEVDGVVVFNPAVGSIRIQWNGVYGGNPIVLGESPDYRRRVHLFDAGDDPPVRELPGSEGEGYFLATASANPIHHKRWDSKSFGLKKQYSVLWSVEELEQLIDHWDLVHPISVQQLYNRYAVVGGVPRLILSHSASQLLTTVRNRVKSITGDMVRTVMRNDLGKWEALLRTGSEPDAFSMFAMEVKAEGDFDDVKVKFLTPIVEAEYKAQAAVRPRRRTAVADGAGPIVAHAKRARRGNSFERGKPTANE